MRFDLVVPTIGRPSLGRLLLALDRGGPPFPQRVLLVDDRDDRTTPLRVPKVSVELASRIEVLSSGGIGPAGARNAGWRAATAPWVAFLDDDVVPSPSWPAALAHDLAQAGPRQAASQARLTVPLPPDRPPTDWQRNVARLEGAPWITADMAVRRDALARVGGFDERFRRAYREDADLALRLRAAGYELVFGTRAVEHPVGPADRWVSVRLQRGNADDVLMRALHGTWEDPSRRGSRPEHVATVVAFLGALAAAVTGRTRMAGAFAATWLGLTARFAWSRIAPGPRTPDEIATMALTSIAIPFAAVGWWLVGLARLPAWLADSARAPSPMPTDAPVHAEVSG